MPIWELGGEILAVMRYNGLKQDLNTFAKLVYIYETQIKFLYKEKMFVEKYSKAYSVYKQKIRSNLKYATREGIKHLDDKIITSKLYFTRKRVLILDLLRHIRNSFSHGLLIKDSKNLKISDKYRQFKTSKGSLEYSTIKEFIVEIIKQYED